MSDFGRNFLPGPTDVRPEVLAAQVQPMFPHRGPRMQGLLAGMQPALQACFGTVQPVFVATCSGTGLIEAAIRSGVRERVLVPVGGYFGEYFARIAESCGKQVFRVEVHPGTAITPAQLEQFLEGPAVDAVAVVHSESSTGALADIPALAQVVKARKDLLLLVDGVTSVGAMPIEMDRWGADFYCTGSQKAMALPPGLAMGAASERFQERAARQDDAGYYQSVRAATSKYGWPALNTEGGADPLCNPCASPPPDTKLSGSAGYTTVTFSFIQKLTNLYDANTPSRINWVWWPAGDWTDTTTSPLGTLDCNSSPQGWGCQLKSEPVTAIRSE